MKFGKMMKAERNLRLVIGSNGNTGISCKEQNPHLSARQPAFCSGRHRSALGPRPDHGALDAALIPHQRLSA
jgi:hypothetical protein